MITKNFLVFVTCTITIDINVLYGENVENFSKYVDTLISSDEEIPGQFDKETWLWNEYDFKRGFVNHEELRIIDIQIYQNLNLQQNITNWQYVKHKYETYIAGTVNTTLFLYHFDPHNNSMTSRANLSVAETIKSFKIISFPSINEESTEIKESIVVILSVENALLENQSIQYLKWYFLQNQQFYSFWIWELLKPVKSLTYFNAADKHKLMVLYERDVYFNRSYLLIEVYDINTSRQFSKRLCCQFVVNEISDIRICPLGEGSKTFTLIDRDYVTLHEYKDILSKCSLKSVKNITVSNVNNVICFESSNINHLVISGFVINFFKLRSNEFIYEKEVESLLNEIGDIHFTKDWPIDTYRNDVILFVQSKNFSVFALSWENEKFQFIHLPNNNINGFDLAKLIVIPNYGFLYPNSTFLKLKVELVQLPKPKKSDIESLFRIKSILEDTFNNQELKISKIVLETQSNYSNDLKIQNLNTNTQIEVDNLSVNETNNFIISIESSNITLDKLQRYYDESKTLLYELENEISQIENQIKSMDTISLNHISFLEEIYIDGNLVINGTAVVKSLFTDYLNNIDVDILMNNCLITDKKIIGNKTFPTVNFAEGHLKIKNLNGVPIENFQFEEDNLHLTDIDLTKIKKLQLKNNLNVSTINDINWNMLIDQLVFRNKKKVIPGRTQFSGIMKTSFTQISYLNDFEYPHEYVVKSGPKNGEVTGFKSFETLTVSDLRDVKIINDIDADEFITLTANQNLEHKISFENVVIEENLQVDGRIIGSPDQYVNPDLTLLNSNIVQSNAMFRNLYVSGKVYVENLIDGIEWSEIDDLILKDDESAIVTGTKIFSNNVRILGNIEITTNLINEHPIKNFITLDSRQIMPNLSKITGNIKFTGVTYKELENIEDKLRIDIDDTGVPKCSMKTFVFLEAPVVDEFVSSFINGNITGSDFSNKFEVLLNDINFENLKCKKLIVKKLKALSVNNINITDLEDKKITKNTYQEISGMIKINNFETKNLHSRFINNRSYEKLNNIVRKINLLYRRFIDNQRSIYSLNINKFIITPQINDKILHDFLDLHEIAEFLLQTNGSVEHLTVQGLINNLNLTKKMSDCVLKNEETIIIKGPKKINRFKTLNLEVKYLNNHSVQDIVTHTKNQTLIGPIIIKGSVYVLEKFDSRGKINDVNYENMHVDIEKVNDTIYTFTGDFLIDDYLSIKNLIVAGQIQEKDIIQFLDNLIYLNDTRVMISSTKIFNNTVKFNDYVTASKRLNDVELELFYKYGIFIDKSAIINSALIFENDVLLEKDLVIQNSLKVNTIKGINVENMMENAVYFNRPTSIMESVTVSNVIFKSDITAMYWNNTNLDMVLMLNKDEVIDGTLACVNINVNNLTISGSLNNENLMKVYENTFMISTDQHVNGTISFLNNVHVHGDLISRYVNNIDIIKIISLENNDTMEGNFVFERPVVINSDMVVQEFLNNNINISQWHSNAITISLPSKYILKGNWTINYNSTFENHLYGSGFINDISIDRFSNSIRRENEEMEKFILNKTEDIKTFCKNLQKTKTQIDHLVYKFKSFEYYRVLKFDKKIESIYHFEFNDTDYVLVNFEICHMDIYVHTNEGFSLFANISNFGNINQYLDFNYNKKLYFVTVGKAQCGKNSGNVWMLENKQVKHIYDLGNVTSTEKLSEVTFVLIVDHQIQEWSIENINQHIYKPTNTRGIKHNNIKFLTHDADILLASCDIIYQLQNRTFKINEIENPFKSTNILSLKAGIHQKEYILLHDDQINSDHIFIYNEDLFELKELQSIHTQKPNSFTMINFDGLYESLLVFSENKRRIQIYEYKGIEYFKFHSSIQMKVDKLYSFQMQTRPYFVKRQCIAIVNDFKLTILEAKMYGEKLDANNELICSSM
ncbi:uncharacterized protein LOC131672587 [Phymastichus coffea]|uniref:uncharacterized protein LOC131672587 n=1 Tax=Phymastichus coffea TaxID=108790 RepID=UPI00273B8DB3|nr:uncharacterized protein LOC131672587 [Phymastichus coffea]